MCLQEKVQAEQVRLGQDAVLVVKGKDVAIKFLGLDGALVIDVAAGASLTVDGAVIKNRGWAWQPNKEGPGKKPATEEQAIRCGFERSFAKNAALADLASSALSFSMICRAVEADHAQRCEGYLCCRGFLVCKREAEELVFTHGSHTFPPPAPAQYAAPAAAREQNGSSKNGAGQPALA